MRAPLLLLISILGVYFESVLSLNNCNPSITTTSGIIAPNKNTICSGDLIFEELFDNFDLTIWEHENTLAGGGVSQNLKINLIIKIH